jgi:hypothetical protein
MFQVLFYSLEAEIRVLCILNFVLQLQGLIDGTEWQRKPHSSHENAHFIRPRHAIARKLALNLIACSFGSNV